MALLKEKAHFGLDIGTTGIRLVELSAGQTPNLVTYGAETLPQPYLKSDSVVDHEKLSAAIRQLVEQSKVTTNQVVAGISSSNAFTAVITTPQLHEKELGKAIKLQADQYIPMPVEEVKLDWHIIGPTGDGQMEVMLVSAPNTAIDKYARIIEGAGLELMALETNAVAVSRSLGVNKEVPVIVVDAGSTNTEVTCVYGGVPRLVRSLNVGRLTLQRSVEQKLNLETEQAEQFMQKFGVTQTKLEGQVLKAMKTPLDNLMGDITKSIKFFLSQNTGLKVEKVILTGGTTNLPEFPVYVANALQLPVEIANPWASVAYPANSQEQLMTISSQFAVAVGLAQRGLV